MSASIEVECGTDHTFSVIDRLFMLTLVIGDLHIPHRKLSIPEQFLQLVRPGEVHNFSALAISVLLISFHGCNLSAPT
jgi:hypothetical protein